MKHLFTFWICVFYLSCPGIVTGQEFVYKGTNLFGLQAWKEDSTQVAIMLVFADTDNDGDQDIYAIGTDSVDYSGNASFDKIKYFIAFQENKGSRWQPNFAPRKPVMNHFPFPNGYFFPAAGDLNNDKKIDFVVCAGVDSFLNLLPLYYERKSLTGEDQFNIVGLNTKGLEKLGEGDFYMPSLGDFDLDGDLDILLSGFRHKFDENLEEVQQPIFLYAKNIGTPTQASYLGWYENPFGLEAAIDQLQLSLVGDIDNDNDNDILSLTTVDTFTVFSF